METQENFRLVFQGISCPYMWQDFWDAFIYFPDDPFNQLLTNLLDYWTFSAEQAIQLHNAKTITGDLPKGVF